MSEVLVETEDSLYQALNSIKQHRDNKFSVKIRLKVSNAIYL